MADSVQSSPRTGNPPGNSTTTFLGRFYRILPWFVVLAISILYWLTRSPSLVPGDPAEFVTAAVTLGICHPTGYPLYVLLGKVATLAIPFFTPAAVLNALSGFYLLATLVVLLLALERMCIAPVSIATALIMLGTTPSLWASATVAEVYTLHALLIAVIVLLAVSSTRDPARQIVAVFFVAGLSLGNHMTSALMAPALIVWLAWLWRHDCFKLHSSSLFMIGLAYVLGASVIATLFVLDRPDTLNYIDQYAVEYSDARFEHVLSRIMWLLRGEQYEAASGFFKDLISLRFTETMPNVVLRLLHDDGLLLILGIVGLAVTAIRDTQPSRPRVRGMAIFLFVTVVCKVLFFSTYAQSFEAAFFAAGYVACAVGLASVMDRYLNRRGCRTVFALVLVMSAVYTVKQHYPSIDRSDNPNYQKAVKVLLENVEPEAVIFSTWGHSTLLWHEQWVSGMRPDVTVVNALPSSWGRLESQFEDRPRYFDRVPPQISDEHLERFYGFYKWIPTGSKPKSTPPELPGDRN